MPFLRIGGVTVGLMRPDALPASLAATRASTGYYRDAGGWLRAAAADVLRNNQYVRNNATGLYERAVLLEAARSNAFATYSTDLSQGAWTRTGVLLPAMVAMGPDGVATSACRLIEDASTGFHSISRNITVAAGQPVSLTVWRRSFGRAGLNIQLRNLSTADRVTLLYDSVSGIMTASTQGAGIALFSDVQVLGDGHIMRLAGIVNGTDTTIQIYLGLQNGATGNYTGDGVSGVDLFNVQPEANVRFPSSAMPTGAGGFTRAVDLAALDLTDTVFALPTPGSYYLSFIEQGHILASGSSGVFPRLMQRGLKSPTSGTNGLSVFAQAGFYRARWIGFGISTDAVMLAAPVPGDRVELLVQISATGLLTCTQTINGVAAAPVTGATRIPFAAAYSDAKIYLNASDASGADAGIVALQSFAVSAGDTVFTVPVSVQGATEGAPTVIGSEKRAFAGNLRSSVRAEKRTWTFPTTPMTAADAATLRALVANGAQVTCDGDALDGPVSCRVQISSAPYIATASSVRRALTLTLSEV